MNTYSVAPLIVTVGSYCMLVNANAVAAGVAPEVSWLGSIVNGASF